MKCIRCGQEMVNISGGNYQCPSCGQAINDLIYRGEPQQAMMKAITVEATCVLCGATKEYLYNELHPFVYICDDCKEAITWAKENMKEKENE